MDKHPRDPYVGYIVRATDYTGCFIDLRFANDIEGTRNVRRTLPVIPNWGACARCHRLSIVTDSKSRFWCNVGAVREANDSNTTLIF